MRSFGGGWVWTVRRVRNPRRAMRAEKEAGEPSRAVGASERRAEGAQGRNPSPGRRARPDRDARGFRLPALRLGPEHGDGDRNGAASGVRPAGTADRGHRASGPCLCLPELRRANPVEVPGRGERAGPIWRAGPGSGGLSQRPATDPGGPDGRDAQRSVRRPRALRGQRGAMDPGKG
jgi:hypothetical protein